MGAVLAPIILGTAASSTAITVATVGINLALYTGVSAASLLLQQSMLPNQRQETGTKLNAVLGGAVNQAIHFGPKETAGSFVYRKTWGRSGKVPNAFLVRVYNLSDRRIAEFEDYVWAGSRKCSYDPGETTIIDGVDIGHPIEAFDNNGTHRLWVKFHDGSQTVADGYLTAKFGSDPTRPWTPDHIGRGRPYMIVTQKYDKKEPSGEIDVIAVIKSSKYYDWRSDSTNGGSGSQRYGNYSTYGTDPGNNVVDIYNVMRGVYEGNEWMFGGQKWPAMRFDNDTWTAAANKCDTNVSLVGGGTQKWARLGAEIDCSEEPWTVIERGLKACGGRIVESGGVFKIYVGGIGASVYSFTDDNIIVSEELTARLFPSRDRIANTITGTYVEPANAGEAKAFKARFNQDYIDEDGDVRKSTMDFEYVRNNVQAQRLARLALNDNRRFRTFVVAFWTQARKLEPCDVVSWTSERFAFSSKKFIVGDVTLREDGIVIVNLREADATDADWSTSDEDAYETGVYEDDDVAAQVLVPTFSAASITDDDDTTARRPAIQIQATLDDDFVDCRALLWEVRKRNGDQAVIADGRSEAFFDPDSPRYGDIVVSRNAFLPNKRVQIRVKIEPESDRETTWSNWATTSFYPGGNTYLQLTDARLTIDTGSTTGDVDIVDTENIRPYAVYSQTIGKVKLSKSGSSGTGFKFLKKNIFMDEGTADANDAAPLIVGNPLKIDLTVSIDITTTLGIGGSTSSTQPPYGKLIIRLRQKGTQKSYVLASITIGKYQTKQVKTQKTITIPSNDASEQFLVEADGTLHWSSSGSLQGISLCAGKIKVYVQKR